MRSDNVVPTYSGKRILALLILGLALVTAYAQTPETEKPVADLIKQLGDDDSEVREAAHHALEDIGLAAEESLKEATHSKDAEVRMRAEQILMVINLKERISFSDKFLAEFPNIYHDLYSLDTEGKFKILLKVTSLDENERYKYWNKVTRQDIAGLIGEVFLENGKTLGSTQKTVILAICMASRVGHSSGPEGGWYQPIPETAPYIIELLKDKDMTVRMFAVQALGKLGAKEAIPELTKLLKVKHVRGAAASALGKLGVKEAIPEITKLLKGKDTSARECAAHALVRLGSKEGIPELTKLLKAESRSERIAAAMTLGDHNVRGAIPEITNLLKDEDCIVRMRVAMLLGEVKAKEAIPELIKLLNDENMRVRASAVTALSMLNAKEVIPELIELLQDKDLGRCAALALGRLNAKEAIPELVKQLKDKDSDIRRFAASALGMLNVKEAIPEIVKLLKVKNARVRAVLALIELGAKDQVPKEVIPDLKEFLRPHVGGATEMQKQVRAALRELGVEVEKEEQ